MSQTVTVSRAFSARLPSCMGGNCSHRDHCQRHLTEHREHVVERLCMRGQEVPEPVFVARFVESEIARGTV